MESRTKTRQRARPDVRPSGRATAAAAALEYELAPRPVRRRRDAPAPRSPRLRAPRLQAPRLRAPRLRAPRLDRIVRGRAWIPVIGAVLVAIVGLRVEVLKLGASVGSEVQLASTLQSSNAELRAQISALSDNQRIVRLATADGMRMPNPLDTHFVQPSAGHHVGAAIRNISAPSRQAFLSSLAAEEHSDQVTAQAGSALSAVGGAPAPSTSSGAGTTSDTSAGGTSPTGVSSTSTAGYANTGASATGTTAVTGTAAVTGTTAVSSSPSSTDTSSATLSSSTGGGTSAGSPSAGTADSVTASGATNSTDVTPSTDQVTGSTSGGTGLAG